MRQTVLTKGPKLRKRVLLAAVFFAPLLFMRNLHDAINLPKLWLVIVAVTIVATIRIVEWLQGADRTSLQRLLLPAGTVLIPLALGWVFSPFRMWALLGDAARYTGLIPYVFLILLGILIADAFADDLMPLAWALVGSAAVAGAYALIQVAGADPFDWTYKGATSDLVTSTFGNPNFAGGFFSIVLPVAVGVVAFDRERRAWAWGCLACVAAGWLVTRSEAAWGAGLGGLAVLAGGLLMKRGRPLRAAGFVVSGLIAVGGVVLVALSMIPSDSGVTPRNLERRGEWWEASLGMVADSPLVGRGPNAFAIEHTRHRTLKDVDEAGFDVTDDPHSVPLSLATSAGIPGAMGFIVLAGWILITTWRACDRSGLALTFGAAGCAYLIQSLFSVDTVALRLAGWTVMGGLAAGMVTRGKSHTERKRAGRRKATPSAQPLKGLPGVVAAVIVALGVLWWSTGLVTADAAFARAQRALNEGDGQTALASFEDALGYRDNDAYVRTYGSVVTSIAVGLVKGENEEAGRELFSDISERFRSIRSTAASSSALAFARALRDWAEVDPDAGEQSLQEYQRAAQLDPRNYLLLHEAAVAATSFGELGSAESMLVRGLALRETAELWGQLAVVHVESGDDVSAQEAIEKALALDPDQEDALRAQELVDD